MTKTRISTFATKAVSNTETVTGGAVNKPGWWPKHPGGRGNDHPQHPGYKKGR